MAVAQPQPRPLTDRRPASHPPTARRVRALGPVALIVVLAGLFLATDPVGDLPHAPPTEALAVEQTVFTPGRLTLDVRNDSAVPVTVAQVQVNEAYWRFSMTDPTLERLQTATLTVGYPWEDGMPVTVVMLTATGAAISHHVDAASATPPLDAATLRVYALLGVYIGVVPVAVGLLWLPALRGANRRWLTFFLAFTLGLLAYLLVDTVGEGFELAAATATALDGVGLFALGALAAILALTSLSAWLRNRRGSVSNGLVVAYLIAAGIGLHNLGEGLAVGAALAAGETALGTFLVLGFALHNTTEGLAIVAPLGDEPTTPPLAHFLGFGAVAGLPTILGAWTGGYAAQPALATIAFGLAAGAIAAVLYQIARGLAGKGALGSPPGALGLGAGFLFMYLTGLLVAAA